MRTTQYQRQEFALGVSLSVMMRTSLFLEAIAPIRSEAIIIFYRAGDAEPDPLSAFAPEFCARYSGERISIIRDTARSKYWASSPAWNNSPGSTAADATKPVR